jgi:hypothetical protein
MSVRVIKGLQLSLLGEQTFLQAVDRPPLLPDTHLRHKPTVFTHKVQQSMHFHT